MRKRTMPRAHTTLLLILSIVVATNCGGGDEVRTVALSGAVEKGPFVLGSSIAVSPVDKTGTPSGQVFNTSTIDNLGRFNVTIQATGSVSLEGSGFYYNEVTSALSVAPIVLRAYASLTDAGT
ncbi:MAG: hypothetical protein V2A73_22405 [Pseudomonadota bacterium]